MNPRNQWRLGEDKEEEEDMSTIHWLMILYTPSIPKKMLSSLFESRHRRFHQIYDKSTYITSVQYACDDALFIFQMTSIVTPTC